MFINQRVGAERMLKRTQPVAPRAEAVLHKALGGAPRPPKPEAKAEIEPASTAPLRVNGRFVKKPGKEK